MSLFPADLILQNERALLRPLESGDEIYFKDFAIHEPEIWEYSLVPVTVDTIKSYVDQAIAEMQSGKSMAFIVFDKLAGAYGGCTRYYDINVSASSLLLGFTWYGKAFQRTGLNKNCKYLLLEYAFEKLNLERVEFRADSRNERSIAAMKSIGCTVEGVFRNHLPLPDGSRRDSTILSILKDEWFDTVKERIAGQL